ncbi:MAG: helix-turn-helix domain-containing protein [Oscillospiraceae bacterium]|nr:helix-turn-helix domain-containing protein [Oscillospiraceae bacterium]
MKDFGETLKRIRKQKDMTQEQLAEYLNISPQSVSKWETNLTLPDITMIPILANMFDVTTDMLLGVDIDAKEKRIDTIRKEASNYLSNKQYDEAEKLLRAGLKEYPNSHILMYSLVSALSSNESHYYRDFNDEEKKIIEKEGKIFPLGSKVLLEEGKIVREEVITLSERILAECTDDILRHLAIQHLCGTYASMGELEKAKSFAEKMPSKIFSRNNLITQTLMGTERYNHLQNEILTDILSALNYIDGLMYTTLDDGTEPYNSDELIELHHKIIDIINILTEKGSLGDFNYRLFEAHQNLTFLYAQKNDAAAALNHFKLAAKYAVLHDSILPVNDDSREEYTNLLFKGIKFPVITIARSYTMTEYLLEKSRRLDSVLPASELEEIRNELRKHTAIN